MDLNEVSLEHNLVQVLEDEVVQVRMYTGAPQD